MVQEGDEVEFKGKDSYFKGTIVSIFTKLDGVTKRLVVQDDRGLLLIKNLEQAKLVKEIVTDFSKIDYDGRI